MPRISKLAVTVSALITVMVVQGALAALPHDHAAAPAQTEACEDPGCATSSTSHLDRDALTAPVFPCLACTAHGVAFSDATPPSIEVLLEATDCRDSNGGLTEFGPRTWQPPLRGPPPTV